MVRTPRSPGAGGPGAGDAGGRRQRRDEERHVYRGVVDRDNTIVWVFDGLKRIVVRDSKIARIDSEDSLRNLEAFKLVQPLVVHGGVMPKEVLRVEAEPWNDKGRRIFTYLGSRSSKPIRMEQAINELGPYLVKLRGVDGFWLGQLATRPGSPRGRARPAGQGRADQPERTAPRRPVPDPGRVVRRGQGRARRPGPRLPRAPREPSPTRGRPSASSRRRSSRTRSMSAAGRSSSATCMVRLRTFPTRDVSSDVLVAVRDQLRHEEAQAAADKALAASLRGLAEGVPSGARMAWRKPLVEVLQALAEAPDAVRDRFVAWQKAKLEPGTTDEARFALAMSGFVVGADAAVPDLEAAATLLEGPRPGPRLPRRPRRGGPRRRPAAARRAQAPRRAGAAGHDPAARPGDPAGPADAPAVARRRRDPGRDPGPPRRGRRTEDPTEYAVLLPPEYHPLRSYPAVVALHDGRGPHAAIDWWAAEAARRGYIVIAPEYNLPGQGPATTATRRASTPPSSWRCATRGGATPSTATASSWAGQLVGGNMAWDFGLAHPDLFAGRRRRSRACLASTSSATSPHVEQLPLYVVDGRPGAGGERGRLRRGAQAPDPQGVGRRPTSST